MLNIVVLIGRLTKDPVLRQTKSGLPVSSFSIAVNNGYGENQTVDFINIVAWRNLAENVCKYLLRGSLIAVEGRIQTRTYEGNDGIKREQFEIQASNIKFLDTKNKNTMSNNSENNSTSRSNVDDIFTEDVDVSKDNFDNLSPLADVNKNIDESNPTKENTTFDISDDDLPF